MYYFALLFLSLVLGLFLQVRTPIPVHGTFIHIPWLHAIVIYYALHHRIRIAIFAALVGSVLFDSFSAGQPGITLFLYGVMIFIADRFRKEIVSDATVTAVVFGMGLGFALCVLQAGAFLTMGRSGMSVLSIIIKTFFTVLIAGICTPCVCHLMRLFHRMLDLSEAEEGSSHVNA